MKRGKYYLLLITVFSFLIIYSNATATPFTIPFNSILFFSSLPAEAAAVTEFGIGNSINNYTPFFTGLPNAPNPNDEVMAGFFNMGDQINFYEKTIWEGVTYWAFSNSNDYFSIIAFNYPIIQTSINTWVLNLDDAASFNIDDDNNDVRIQIRLEPVIPVPEPATMLLLGSGLLGLWGLRKKLKN